MRVVFLRHAEVQEDYIGKYNGHIDISLSQKGRLDAKRLSKEMKNIDFDKIYCSDLKRTRETLELLEIGKDAIFSDRLREKSWGESEGKSFYELGIKYIDFKQFIKALGGEDLDSYIKKCYQYFLSITSGDATNILIVTHGGFIRAILSKLQNISFEESFNIKIPYSSTIIVEV